MHLFLEYKGTRSAKGCRVPACSYPVVRSSLDLLVRAGQNPLLVQVLVAFKILEAEFGHAQQSSSITLSPERVSHHPRSCWKHDYLLPSKQDRTCNLATNDRAVRTFLSLCPVNILARNAALYILTLTTCNFNLPKGRETFLSMFSEKVVWKGSKKTSGDLGI